MLPQLASSDLRALAVFDVIVEFGGFSSARHQLNVNESTISSQISGFESRIGFKLCTRGRAGFQLTKRGKVVLDEYRKLNAAMDIFRQTINALENNAVGSLRVGTLEQTLGETEFSFIELFDQFINRAPNVDLHVMQSIQSELYQAVIDERIDIALGAFNIQNKMIKSESLYTEQQYIYCGCNHDLYNVPADKITPDLLRNAMWVSRGYHLSAFSNLPINTSQVTATSANLEAVIAIVLAGHHLSYLPKHFANKFERSGKIKRLLPEKYFATLNFSIISKRARHETRSVKLFREIALSQLAKGS